MKLRILPVLMVVILLMPFVVAAQANPNACTGGENAKIGECVSQIYLWSLGLSALLAVAMSVFGGYLVMTARGNAQQATNGKSYIYSSLVGMLLLIGAFVILNTINPDLTNFSTPEIDKFTQQEPNT